MTNPDPRNIMQRLGTALEAPKYLPVRIWLEPLDYAAICAVVYRASKGESPHIRYVQDLPTMKDIFGQPSRIVAYNGKVTLI